jgi:MoaA/NifB/PqqE/SkfB family radical SAM enzyme
VLRLNLHPLAMEHLGSRPAEPTRACIEEIDRCDAFVGIYGWRYGFQPQNGGPSITEQEYHHARARKKPIFAFLVHPDYRQEPPPEPDPGVERLAPFKEQIRRQVTCDVFKSPSDLAERVVTALANERSRLYALATGDLTAVDWDRLPKRALSSLLAFINSGETEHQRTTLQSVAAVLINRYPGDEASGADAAAAPVVWRREWFGSLPFVRQHDDYVPFDLEGTEILVRAGSRSIDELAAALSTDEQRTTLRRFGLLCREAGILNQAGMRIGAFLPEGPITEGRLSAPTRVILACTRAATHSSESALVPSGLPLPGELTTREVRRLIDELVGNGCFLLDLDGGEPLVRADLPAILEHARNKGMSVSMATHAAAATQEVVGELTGARIARLTVRFDGATAEVVDAIRQQAGAFDGAMRGITRLKRLGIPMLAQWLVTRRNVHQLPEMVDLAKGLDLQPLRLYAVPALGPAARRPDLVLNAEETVRLYTDAASLAERTGVKIVSPRTPRHRFFKRHCACGTTSCHVDPIGGLSPSGFETPPPGDSLRERPLSDIWASSPLFNAWRHRPADDNCPGCNYFAQ